MRVSATRPMVAGGQDGVIFRSCALLHRVSPEPVAETRNSSDKTQPHRERERQIAELAGRQHGVVAVLADVLALRYAASGCRAASAVAAASTSSASGGLAPSRAHGSSNSTRHLASSVCCNARRARKLLPERPLKPVTAFSVRPVLMSSRATDPGSSLPPLAAPIPQPQPAS